MPRRRKSVYERGICIRLPSLLLDTIDAHAKADFPPQSRSDAMRELLEHGLRKIAKWPPPQGHGRG